MSRPRLWIITDGKAGDEAQCLGVAEALGLEPELKHTRPRALFSWAMPRGPMDPREAPGRAGSPFAPPFPDVVIASGRRAVPVLRTIKRQSPATLTVFLKDPRTGAGTADIIWVPAHDRLRGANVVVTTTSPHRMSAARLAAARENQPPELAALPRPRAAVLVGGDSRHHRFTDGDIARFTQALGALIDQGLALAVTLSRRTPPALGAAIRNLVHARGGYLWNGAGENPLLPMLATADQIVVTADSVNMVGEAVATGVPVLVFEPSGGHRKVATFLEALERAGAVKRFTGQVERYSYAPIDPTPAIASAIREALAARNIFL